MEYLNLDKSRKNYEEMQQPSRESLNVGQQFTVDQEKIFGITEFKIKTSCPDKQRQSRFQPKTCKLKLNNTFVKNND